MADYVRRSDAEIEIIDQRLRWRRWQPWRPLLIAVVTAPLLAMFSFVMGGEVDKPLEGGIESIVREAVAFAVLGFALFYYMQVRDGRPISDSSHNWMCARCLKRHDERLSHCPCGGVMEPLEYYRRQETTADQSEDGVDAL